MSTINDVLRGLDQRHQDTASTNTLSMVLGGYDEKPKRFHYTYWLALPFIIILTWIVISVIKVDSSDKSDFSSNKTTAINSTVSDSVNELPEINGTSKKIEASSYSNSHYEFTKGTDDNSVQLSGKKINEVDLKSPEVLPTKAKIVEVDSKTKPKNISTEPSYEDKAQISDITIKKVRKPVYDYAKLLRESPQSIWPIIQSLNVNLDEFPSLLAIAAQAEQRIGNHNSAIKLYNRLLILQPKEAKWKIAAAISFDHLNQSEASQRLYLQGLQSESISPSLKEFVINRLNTFSSRSNDEK